MRRFLIILIFPLIATAETPKTTIMPGELYMAKQGELVVCKLPQCQIEFSYVDSTYRILMPDGRLHGSYASKNQALDEGKRLVDLRVCQSFQLPSEN